MQGNFEISPRIVRVSGREFKIDGYHEDKKGKRKAVASIKTDYGYATVTDSQTRYMLMEILDKKRTSFKHKNMQRGRA